jgi:hypothetical protein
MGRTVLPFTQELYREEDSWKPFRRALRRRTAALRRAVRRGEVSHPACTCSGRAVPFEAILMSILIEERRAARELSRRVEELARRLAEAEARKECPGDL